MRSVLAAGVLALTLVAACSQQPIPESEAAREVAATRAAAAATEAEQAAEAAAKQERSRSQARKDEPGHGGTTIVLDPGGAAQAKTPGELAEAARRDRERYGDRSVGELTDDNLAEMASRGKVTFAGAAAGEEADAGDAQAGGEAGEPGAAAGEDGSDPDTTACGETCWRRRAYELREAWSRSVAEIEELEGRVSDLRWRFYAEDDPWQRDSQIKPAWDRALDELRRAREEAKRYQQRVDDLMDEGRSAGALPGWLREGIELEPKPADESAERDSADPVEPRILEDDSVEPKQQ